MFYHKNPKQLLLQLYSWVPAFWTIASVMRGETVYVRLNFCSPIARFKVLHSLILYCHRVRSFSILTYPGSKTIPLLLLARHIVN